MEKWQITSAKMYPAGKDSNPFSNKFYGYRELTIQTPRGAELTYYGVDIKPVVHAVAIDDDLTTYLVMQERPNLCRPGQTDIPRIVELPGGFADQPTLEESIRKELAEEIGRRPKMLELMGIDYPLPSISNEHNAIFLATDLQIVPRTLTEESEKDMRIINGPFGKLFDKCKRGEWPIAASTLVGMTWAAERL